MFRGSSFQTIDDKGRIIIPARFRDIINGSGSNGVMISRMDSCLVGYTFDEWIKIEKRILSLAEKSEAMRRFRRVFIGGAPRSGRGALFVFCKRTGRTECACEDWPLWGRYGRIACE